MISDVLSDALAAIEEYENDPTFNDVYPEQFRKARIAPVKAAMRDLQRELDTLPTFNK